METTALPPTEREKIRWGYMGKQAAGTATAKRQTDGTPQGIYGENTVGLLGNFPSRIAGNAENSPIRQGASPFALPVEDCISPLSKIVRFIVLQAKKEGADIYIYTGKS